MKKILPISTVLLFLVLQVNAQTITNNINIGSSLQGTSTATTFNQWLVTAMSPDMQGAFCYGNTTTAVAIPAPTPANNPPVAVGQPAVLLANSFPSWPAGSYLSPFIFNTIYTQRPAVSNFNNCTLTIRRRFVVCSTDSQQVTFALSVRSDDVTLNAIVDAGTPGASFIYNPATPAGLNPPAVINATRTLAPGLHTLDITTGNYEDTQGAYFPNFPNLQWNPFGVSVAGTITAPNNVLLNGNSPAISPITGLNTLCSNTTITLSDATPGGTWSSSNTGIATIDQNGTVTGIAPGNTTIFYTIAQGNCSSTASYAVEVTSCHCEDSCNWSLTGNTFVKSWNFIGSLNNADFKIRTNNTQRMLVTAAGNVGINTLTPGKLLDVNGEARVATLPSSAVNDKLVMANSNGDLRALPASGNTNEYLSGNGTWQLLSTSGGTVNADQGCTVDGSNTVLLGDYCGSSGGAFTSNRQINMNNMNLFFHSGKAGKIFMGSTFSSPRYCQQLYTRLEIGTQGLLGAVNDYSSPDPSTSGLRFSDLTAKSDAVGNKYGGVLSLDEDGDVIWVKACCDKASDPELKQISDRLTKLETELAETKSKLAQMDVLLEKNNIILLDQNIPNPFNESTVISYMIPKAFVSAQLIFTSLKGEIIKTVDIKSSGKGQVNVSAANISSGMYSYTLVIDGKVTETKKMMKL